MDVGGINAHLGLDLSDFIRKLKQAQAQAAAAGKKIAQAMKLDAVSRGMNNLVKQAGKLTMNMLGMTKVQKGIQGWVKDLRRAELQAKKTGQELRNITRGIVLAQTFYRSWDAIRKATNAVREFAMEAENAEKSFAIMLRSEEQSAALVDHLKSFAAATQFSFETASKAAKQLLAYGFKLQDMDRMMNALGDASAAMGDSEAFGRVAKALGQIRTKGKLATQELLQLTEVGIPAFEILQEQLGLTKDQLGNIAKSGIDANTAIEALLTGIEQRYGGAMEALADTVGGYLNNIKETFVALMAEITDPFYQSMKAMLKSLSTALGDMQVIVAKSGLGGLINEMFSPEMQKVIRQLAQAFQIFGASVKNLLASLAPFIQEFLRIASVVGGVVMPVISLFMNLMSALLQVLTANTAIMNAFRVAVAGLLIIKSVIGLVTALGIAFKMLTSPIMLVIAGLTAVIALIANIAGQGSKVTGIINGIGQAINDLYGMNKGDVLPPDISEPPNFGDIVDGLEDTEDALEDTGDAAEKAAKNLMSFDEVFNLTEKDTSGGLDGMEFPEIDMTNPLEGFGMEFDTSGAEESLKTVGDYVQDLVNKIKKAFDDNGGVFNTFRLAINKVADDLVAGTQAMIAYLKSQFGPSWDSFWTGAEIIIVGFIEAIRRILLGAVDILEGVCRIVKGIITSDWEEAWAGFYQVVEGASEVYNGLLDATESLLTGVLTWLKGVFGPSWESTWDFFIDVVRLSFTWFRGIVDGIAEIFIGLVEIVASIITNDWALAIDGLGKIAEGLGTVVDVTAEGIKEALEAVLTYLSTIFGPSWDGILQAIGIMLSSVVDNIAIILHGIITAAEGVLLFLAGVFTGDWEVAWLGVSQIMDGFLSVFEGLLGILQNLLQGILDFLNAIFGPNFDSIFTFIGDVVDAIFKGIGTKVEGLITIFSGILEFLLGVFTGDWERAWTGVKNIFTGVGDLIIGAVEIVLGSFKAFIDWIVRDFTSMWNTTWENMQRYFSGTASALKAIVDGLLTTLRGIIDFIVGVFTGNWERAWTGVKNVFKGIFDSLVAIAKAPINFIIDLINGAIDGINTLLKTVNKVPGVNIPTIPHIPALAKGGIVQQHTLAEIGEGNKKEAVIPLENGRSTSIIADKILQGMPGGGQQAQQAQQPQQESVSQNSGGQFQGATVLYVDTLIADERSLRELERKLEVIRKDDDERRG